MLVSYLEKNYGYNEPIFINNIKIDGIKENALRLQRELQEQGYNSFISEN